MICIVISSSAFVFAFVYMDGRRGSEHARLDVASQRALHYEIWAFWSLPIGLGLEHASKAWVTLLYLLLLFVFGGGTVGVRVSAW